MPFEYALKQGFLKPEHVAAFRELEEVGGRLKFECRNMGRANFNFYVEHSHPKRRQELSQSAWREKKYLYDHLHRMGLVEHRDYRELVDEFEGGNYLYRLPRAEEKQGLDLSGVSREHVEALKFLLKSGGVLRFNKRRYEKRKSPFFIEPEKIAGRNLRVSELEWLGRLKLYGKLLLNGLVDRLRKTIEPSRFDLKEVVVRVPAGKGLALLKALKQYDEARKAPKKAKK